MTRGRGHQLVQQLQPLWPLPPRSIGHARDVAARPVQAGDKAHSTGSPLVAKTIGIVVVAAFAASAAGVLVAAITATWRRTRSAAKRRQPIILAFRPAVFDRHVLALDIAGFLQALAERGHKCARTRSAMRC